VTIRHPVRGELTFPGNSIRLSASSVPIGPAPLLGQHNEEIYRGMLGLGDRELEALRREGVI